MQPEVQRFHHHPSVSASWWTTGTLEQGSAIDNVVTMTCQNIMDERGQQGFFFNGMWKNIYRHESTLNKFKLRLEWKLKSEYCLQFKIVSSNGKWIKFVRPKKNKLPRLKTSIWKPNTINLCVTNCNFILKLVNSQVTTAGLQQLCTCRN